MLLRPQDQNDLQTRTLLSLGAGLLQAGAPRVGAPGPGIGAALAQTLDSTDRYKTGLLSRNMAQTKLDTQQKLAQQRMDLNAAEIARKAEKDEHLRHANNAMIGNGETSTGLLTDPKERALYHANPEAFSQAYAQQAFRPNKPMTAGNLVQVQGPNGPVWVPAAQAVNQPVYVADKTDPNIREIRGLLDVIPSTPEGSRERQAYESRLHKVTTSRPVAEINMGGQGVNKQVMGRYEGSYKRAQDRQGRMRGLERMLELAPKVESGWGANARLEGAKALRAIGFDVDEASIANAEQFRSLAMDQVLDRIERTKGSISEKEMSAFELAAPGLRNSPEGNQMILKMALEAERRNYLVDEYTQKITRDNPGINLFELDRRVIEYRRKISQKPVFDPEDLRRTASMGPQGLPKLGGGGTTRTLEDRLRGYGAKVVSPEAR